MNKSFFHMGSAIKKIKLSDAMEIGRDDAEAIMQEKLLRTQFC